MRSSMHRLNNMQVPLMNMEGQYLFRSASSALRWVLMLLATASPDLCFAQGTLEQRLACTRDVFRLCSAFIPHAAEVTNCLIEKSDELSDACSAVIESETKQLPGANDSTGTSERITR